MPSASTTNRRACRRITKITSRSFPIRTACRDCRRVIARRLRMTTLTIAGRELVVDQPRFWARFVVDRIRVLADRIAPVDYRRDESMEIVEIRVNAWRR